MKRILLGISLFTIISCTYEKITDEKKYITDSDFKIEVTSWECWGDITDDGITQNVLIDSGSGEIAIFNKNTGEFGNPDSHINDKEFASSSINGMLIFDNYWGTTPKIFDFTKENEYTVSYDSRKDSQSNNYEVSITTVHFKKI